MKAEDRAVQTRIPLESRSQVMPYYLRGGLRTEAMMDMLRFRRQVSKPALPKEWLEAVTAMAGFVLPRVIENTIVMKRPVPSAKTGKKCGADDGGWRCYL